MAFLTFTLEIEYEDGTVEKVTSDQRDIAAWELTDISMPWLEAMKTRTHVTFRWLAWHALIRTNRTEESWDDWSARAVSVSPTDEGESPNPGSSAASGEGS